MPNVSVIIAIYNVENYIEKCLHSLFQQTLNNIEYIFVDDGSTDHSLNILNNIIKLYPNRLSYIKIISHKTNLGIAAARTTGIKASTGEYLIHCDPDDFLEKSMIETLYKKAILTNADITICNIDIHYTNYIKTLKFNFQGTPQEYLKKGINNCFMYASLVNKLIKREIIIDNSILPFEGCNYGEDLGCMIRILYYANRISFVNESLYHYIKRFNSITGFNYTIDNFQESLKLIKHLELFFKNIEGYETLFNFLKFIFKINSRYLFKDKELYWYKLFPECHKDIFKFKKESIKSRLFWWISFKNYYLFLFLKRFIL